MSDQETLIEMTVDIVSAFVSNHAVRPAELPDLIAAIHSSLASISAPKPAEEPTAELKPAVSIKKSVTDDFIISLEDGRKFKSMKRYLSGLGMTPDEYRAKWGLPRDYPMVAPGYAAKRSELAKAAGLGSTRSKVEATADGQEAAAPAATIEAEPEPAAPEPAEAAPEPVAEAPVKRRGRPKKAA